ncbi:MAG: ATP-dependent Clp protease ATP-binding subunit [Bacteroidales bacterium]|nr:ATP-dependent Clp protease ATP-binding subunit [Bacteroidales bacterium]
MLSIDKLGESGKLAITFAEQITRQLRFVNMETGHLFLGVVELKDVHIQIQFQKVGLDINNLRDKIWNMLSKGGGKIGVQIFLSLEVRKSLEVAQREAAALGHDKIEAPHILLGILDNDLSGLFKVIRSLGADPTKLSQGLREMMQKGEWPNKFYGERKTVEQPGIDKSSGLLKKLGRDLTADAEQGKLDPIIGREDTILEIIKILTGRRKNNCIIVGDAGVGKTAIVEGLAQVMVSKKVPPDLAGKRLRSIEMVSVFASGTKYLGEFEKKLDEIIKEAEGNPDLILFIDEIHTLMGARGGAMGAPDILKPALSRGLLKCIGATTNEEYRKHIEKDQAMVRRFQPVFVGEPTTDETLDILWGLRPKYEEFHNVKILDEAVEAAVELSSRYIGDRRLPDKAIDLIDQACSQKKLRLYYGISDLGQLTKEEKRDLFSDKTRRQETPKSILISYEDVARVVSEWTGIPSGKLTEKESVKLLALEELMAKKIVGQDRGISAIARSIRKSRSGLGNPKRPIGSFLFLGPTGVGKTELAKTLAGILFDDEDRIIQIDMSEFYEKHTISRLIGSPHGYVDSDLGGQLTEEVKKQPYSVVLFDEIEKAHPEVLRIMLQILEEGRLTDGLGRPVNFRNTVVIMTSNIGSQRINERNASGMGFKTTEEKDKGLTISDIRGDIERQLRIKLSPEFMNRIDEIVIFNPLNKEDLKKIASIMLTKLKVKVEADKEVIDFLVNARYDPTMGARPLRRTIENLVVDPLANDIIRGRISEHDIIKLALSDGAITFKAKRVIKKDVKEKEKKVKQEDVNEKEDPLPEKEDPGKTASPDEKLQELLADKSQTGKSKDISESKKCKGCGAVNPASNKWCWKCGRDLK